MAPDPTAAVDYDRYRYLKLSLHEAVMTVTLSNPERRNAVTPQMHAELLTIWDDLWQDDEVAAVVLTGDGDHFCAGADFSAITTGREVKRLNRMTRDSRKLIMGMLDFEKPVIAKVRGAAYGMGATMALACDIVFAAADAKFCDSHVKMGLVPGDGGMMLWPLAMGAQRAKEFMLTGDPVSAPDAERLGLINRALPPQDLDDHVAAMASKLAALPPHAVAYTKASLNAGIKQAGLAAFETSLAYEIYSMRTEDAGEAVAAFLEKRPARFGKG